MDKEEKTWRRAVSFNPSCHINYAIIVYWSANQKFIYLVRGSSIFWTTYKYNAHWFPSLQDVTIQGPVRENCLLEDDLPQVQGLRQGEDYRLASQHYKLDLYISILFSSFLLDSFLLDWIGFPSDFCTHRLINLVPRFCAPSTRRSRSICRQCTASPSSSTQHSTTSLRLVNLLERRRIKLFKCASEVRDDRSENLINTINYMVIEW